MSEPRRVAFNTISSNVSQGTLAAAVAAAAAANDNALITSKTSAAFGNSGENVQSSKSSISKHNKTFRFELTLFQTDSSKHPEFNYSQLIHREKKKMKKLKTRMNGFSHDPFDNANDEDCNRIARQLEEKYGSSYGSGRSRKNMPNDRGAGYDDNDSFIDNTEAFDEQLPEEAETLEGGFYINCGALEFKKLQTEQQPLKTKTDEIIKMPNRPKKAEELSTSSSEDTSTTDEDDEVDDDDEEEAEEEGEGEEADDSSTTHNRQKSGNSSSSTTTSVHTKKSTGSRNKSGENKKPLILSSSSNSPKALGEELGSDSDKDRVPVKTTTVTAMIKAKRDIYLKSQNNEEKTNSNGMEKHGESKSTDDEDEDSSSSTGDSEDSDNSAQFVDGASSMEKKLPNTVISTNLTNEEDNMKKQEVKLPPGLSPNLIELLCNFKDTAVSRGLVGKKFQFDERTTEQFLKIDNSLMSLDKSTRNLVLAHLEYHLQLKKYYFLRKEKQFRIKDEKQKNKRALAKLKKCVIETMPIAIANYEAELRKYADLNAANLNADMPPIMPKKEFPWSNNLSNLLYEVYEVRLTSYAVLRTRKQTFDEFMHEYLRSKVLTLWPHGWIRFEQLLAEIEQSKLARPTNNKKHVEPTTSTDMSNLVTGGAGTLTVPSSTNKRKHSDGSGKTRKNKSQKKEQLATTNVTDLSEFAINLQQQQQQTTTQPSNATNVTAAALSALQQQQQQQHLQQIQTHSMAPHVGPTKSAHIIDLDNYKSANDILQTSKQIINAANKGMNFRAESGSESDGVEIVSVYQNRPATAKQNVTSKQQQKSYKQNLTDPLATMNFSAPTNATINLNNNNYSNKKNNMKVNMESLLKDSKNFEQLPTTTISKNMPPTRTANNQ